MTQNSSPKPAFSISQRVARRILAQMGENGKPPESGIAHVNVGNESYLQILDDEYVHGVLRDIGGSSFKLVQGTYGSGKTHFLYCVRDLVGRRGLLTSFVTLSPKECPLDKPLNVYRAVARNVQLPRLHEESEPMRGIDDVLRQVVEIRLEEEGRDATMAWVDKTVRRASVENHAFREAVAAYARALSEGAGESERRLAAWLRGEAVPAGQAKKEGVYEVPGNDNGFSMLRSLVQIAVRLDFAGVALLFDEAERRLSVGSIQLKSTREAMDHLRELIDQCGRSELPNTLLLYAVTPAFIDNVLPEYPALQQRLGSPIQYMSEHNPRAPVVDLEALDLDPRRLLNKLGERLARVSARAFDWSPDPDVVSGNLNQLVATITEEQLEVSHRRLFVKLWIRLLDELRLGGERIASRDEVEAVVRGEQIALLEEDGSAPPLTFFGSPLQGSD